MQEFLAKKREACLNTENVNQIGENVNEIGENVNEIGENVKEDIGQDDSGRPIRDAIVQQDVVEIVKGSNTDTAIMQLDGNISLTEIETEEKIEEEPKQKIRFWMVRNGIEQDEVYQGLIDYGIEESDFCIKGSGQIKTENQKSYR